jgi:hypothetical protein
MANIQALPAAMLMTARAGMPVESVIHLRTTKPVRRTQPTFADSGCTRRARLIAPGFVRLSRYCPALRKCGLALGVILCSAEIDDYSDQEEETADFKTGSSGVRIPEGIPSSRISLLDTTQI